MKPVAKKKSIPRVSSEKPVSERRVKNAEARTARRAKMKWPNTVGACIDMLFALQQQRRAIAKSVDAVKETEIALREHMRSGFKKEKLHGAQGAMARVELTPIDVPNVEDWDKFYTYVGKTKAWDLLQKRLSTTAIRERWDAKKSIPGVKKVPISEIVLHVLPKRKQRK